MAKRWSDGQKLHTRLAYRVRLLNKWKPNNYPKVYGVSVADECHDKHMIVILNKNFISNKVQNYFLSFFSIKN